MQWPLVTELCYHHCSPFWNIFIAPKRTPCPLAVIPQPTHTSPCLATTSLFVSVDLPLLDISYKWDYTTCGPLCLVSFTEYHVSRFIRVVADVQLNVLRYQHQARDTLFSFLYLPSKLRSTCSVCRKELLPSPRVIPFMIFTAGSATGPGSEGK